MRYYQSVMFPLAGKKVLLLVLAVCIVCAVGFSGVFVLTHLDHAHSGDDCAVCLQIEAALTLLRNLALAFFAVFFAALLRFAHNFYICSDFCGVFFLSPVVLKVKLNR